MIDSASANIQIPRREFLKIKEIFLAVDSTVDEYTDPGTEGPILISKKKCVDLFKIYGDVHDVDATTSNEPQSDDMGDLPLVNRPLANQARDNTGNIKAASRSPHC